MRILRGKSNLQVSSQGFALFVLGLVLATFLGGAVRTVLNSDRVQARLFSELKARFPGHEFQIGRTEILLSRGFWPGLGLKVVDLVFRQDVCGKVSFVLEAPTVLIPLDLFTLHQGQVRLGRVEIKGGKALLSYRDCMPAATAGGRPASQALRSAVVERGIQPPKVNWSELSSRLRAVRLRDFEVTYDRNVTWKAMFKSADLELSGGEASLTADVQVEKTLLIGSLVHNVMLRAEAVDNDLSWQIQTEFKEGQLKWSGSWDVGANRARTALAMVQIPLKDLTSELFQMGFAGREIKLKTAWLTCGANWEGGLGSFDASPVRVRACRIEGAYGRVDLDQAEIYPRLEPPLRAPAEVKIQKFQIQPLAEAVGIQVLPAIFARLGAWTGTLLYAGNRDWSLDGALDNFEVIFSNQSVRGKQLVRRAHVAARRSADGAQIRVDGIEPQDGVFSGSAEVQVARDFDNLEGGFQIHVEQLGLSPAIQNLMLGGQISPLRVTGVGSFDNRGVREWSGSLSAANIEGEGWRGEGADVKTRFSGAVFTAEGRVNRVTVDPRWRMFSQLQVVRPGLAGPVSWRDMTAKLEVHARGGSAPGIMATELENGPQWKVKGTWVRDGDMSGTLTVGGPNQPRVYALRGARGSVSVVGERGAGEAP